MTNSTQSGYASVDGLDVYYEVFGEGRPLVLVSGAFMTIELTAGLIDALAATRQVVAVEPQAHGHTANIDRPLRYESMADDLAGVIRQLGIGPTDVLGYSMGAGIGLQLAIRHPDLVRRLVAISVSYDVSGTHQELVDFGPQMTPEMFTGSPFEASYRRTAPDPDGFPDLVMAMRDLEMTPQHWPDDDIRGIAAPTMIVVGDSDAVRLEHAVQMFTLLGGGVMGDLVGVPTSRLAILPGTTHFIPEGHGMLDRVDWLTPMVVEFLDTDPPSGQSPVEAD